MLINDTVRGALKVSEVPERNRFNSWVDFLQALPSLLSVEVPKGIGGVVVSSSDPGEEDRDVLWVRTDKSGGLVGLYAFQGGAWKPFYPLAVGEVVWMVGSSTQVPEGFRLIDRDSPTIPSTVAQAIMDKYVPNALGGYAYFAVEFTGY